MRKDAFLKKANLPKLLVAHLFIRSALQFFRPGLVDDVGDFLFGELATEFGFLTLHGHVPLLDRLENRSMNLGSTPSISNAEPVWPPEPGVVWITDLMQAFGQFVAIDCRAVVDGAEHIARLQCLPTLFFLVPGGVEQDEMRMQLRIKRARRGMQEGRADQIAGDTILFLNATFANPCGGERFKFPDGQLEASLCA